MNPPVITAYTLRYLAACERRVWLDQHGDVTARVAPAPEYASGGIEHEQRIVGRAFGPMTPVPVGSWPEMLRVTQKLMRQGVAGIRGAAFERVIDLPTPVCVRGRVDWLRRVSTPSRLGNWSYEPIEIKQRAALQAEDLLQLDLYMWLVGAAQEREPEGWFWLGRDADYQPLQVIEHAYSESRLLAVLNRVAQVMTAAEAPPIFLGKPCQICPWHSACEQTAAVQ
ncbi:MAG TPA: PD-(D/E)XK nuclease family protein, partial [Phototrophicaceae bacterium]|nr:PD-(D/E)XK nuclease family protein [Phototrophicaceae bacterium]